MSRKVLNEKVCVARFWGHVRGSTASFRERKNPLDKHYHKRRAGAGLCLIWALQGDHQMINVIVIPEGTSPSVLPGGKELR